MLSGIERSLSDMTLVLPNVQAEVVFKMITATSGEQALEIIKQSKPDILLLDHKLGGMDGLEVLEHISRDHNDIMTVMITAYASLETAVTAIKCGAYDFLAKPFTPSELKAVVCKTASSLIHTRQARSLAKERRQVRFQFISVLAHELKAPLAAIEGYLNVIRDRTAGDDQAVYDKMLGRCDVRLRGMRKLILDLLDLTHIESGQKNRQLTEVDVCEMARNSIETNSSQAEQRNIALNLHAHTPVLMMADQSEIEIILNNLISNAVKYNRNGGNVDVSIMCEGGRVKIIVSDTGIGIAPEDVQRLFQDFVRIKNSKTINILGSGLGLSIVKKLAYLYGGDVKVQSEPDQGSSFTITLLQEQDRDKIETQRDTQVA